MEKFVQFLAGISTPHRRLTRTVAEKISAKPTSVEELTIRDSLKRGKQLKGMWKALIRCYNKWIEQPDTRLDHSWKDSALTKNRVS